VLRSFCVRVLSESLLPLYTLSPTNLLRLSFGHSLWSCSCCGPSETFQYINDRQIRYCANYARIWVSILILEALLQMISTSRTNMPSLFHGILLSVKSPNQLPTLYERIRPNLNVIDRMHLNSADSYTITKSYRELRPEFTGPVKLLNEMPATLCATSSLKGQLAR
jgi:hypothetical protein